MLLALPGIKFICNTFTPQIKENYRYTSVIFTSFQWFQCYNWIPYKKTFEWENFGNFANIFLWILLNKSFCRFHTRHNDLVLGNCEGFPVNGHFIDNIRPMDMKLISTTVCMLVSRPYIISIDHSLQIHPFKTSYTLYSSCTKLSVKFMRVLQKRYFTSTVIVHQ